MPVIHLVKCLCTFLIPVIFFNKQSAHTALLYNSKTGLTNDLKSGITFLCLC